MQVGAKLGAYEVISKLGEGGMGEVYRAHDTKLDRDGGASAFAEATADKKAPPLHHRRA